MTYTTAFTSISNLQTLYKHQSSQSAPGSRLRTTSTSPRIRNRHLNHSSFHIPLITSTTTSDIPNLRSKTEKKMVRYVGKVIVPYTRERVFELMSDWRNIEVWDMNIVKSNLAEGHTDPSKGLGTRYDCQFKIGDKDPIGVAYECIKYNAPVECEFQGLATLFKSKDCVKCEKKGDGTEITADFNLDFRGLLSPFSFIMNGTMQKTGPIIMKDIEQFVNSSLGYAGKKD